MKFRDEDCNENRLIQSVFFRHDAAANTERWIAETTLLDATGSPIAGFLR
jgi:hypothetical protein